MNLDEILASFQKAYPDDTILIYRFKNSGGNSFYGDCLLNVELQDGYHLRIYKLAKSSEELLSSDKIKIKVSPVVYETAKEIDHSKRQQILEEKLRPLFPDYYVNIFVVSDSNWSQRSYNTKGISSFKADYGSDVDIVLN